MQEKRNKQIVIRVSPIEFDLLNQKKTRPELARWLRETALGIEQPKSRKKSTPFPPEAARILAGIGNNLNQIAKQLNSAAKVGELDPLHIIRATAELNATERSLNALRDYLVKQSGAEK